MGIEALKQQLKEGKITKEQYLASVKALLDAKTITQEEHDAAIKEEDPPGGNGGGSGALTPEQVQKMVSDAVAAAQQSAEDKIRREYSDKLKQKDDLLRSKMTDEEKAKADLEQAQKDLEQGKRELLMGQVAMHTVDTLNAKALPLSFKSFLVRETKEDTDKAIGDFATEWQKALDAEVDKRFKNGGGDPPGGKGGGKGETNPFDPKTINLTEQGRIFNEDPEKARRLAKEAGVAMYF